MRKLFPNLVFTLFFLFFFTISQAQSWQWGYRAGGTYHSVSEAEQAVDVQVDQYGNSFALMEVTQNNLDVDGIPLPTVSRKNTLITSFDCEGNHRWSKVINTPSPKELDLDAEGNVYALIKATRLDSLHILSLTGTDTVLAPAVFGVDSGYQTLFLTKFSNTGELLWMETPMPVHYNMNDALQSQNIQIETDEVGTSRWMALLKPGLYADGNYEITAPGYTHHIFVYDADGNFIEATQLDVTLPSFLAVLDFVHNPKLNQYLVTGFTSYHPTVSEYIILGDDTLSAEQSFLAAFDTDGSLIWKKTTTPEATGIIQSITLDSLYNIYIGGKAFANDSLGNFNLTPNASGNGFFPFIAKLHSDGEPVWTSVADTDAGYTIEDIVVNGAEVAGVTQQNGIVWGTDSLLTADTRDMLLVRLDRITGEPIQITSPESSPHSDQEYALAIAADPRNNYFLSGQFNHELYVNQDTLISNDPTREAFVVKYGSNDCDCELPTAAFTRDVIDNQNFEYTFTGSQPYNRLIWEFDNESHSTDDQPTFSITSNREHRVCLTVYNACGFDQICRNFDSLSVVNNVSQKALNTNTRLFPNPASSEIHIAHNRLHSHYQVININGSLVLSGELQDSQSKIKIETLPSGFYFIQLIGKNVEQETLKFSKQ